MNKDKQGVWPAASQGRPLLAYRWVVIALFWCIYFLNQGDRQIVFSVLPLIKHDLRVDDVHLGLLSSAFFWVYGPLVLVAGVLGDIWNRKHTIVKALLIWSAATFSSGLVGSFAPLVALMSVTAFGESFYYPSANSIISDYHGPASRGTAMAVHQTAAYCGIVVSSTLAGYIAQRLGWRHAFVIFGTAGVIIAWLTWKVLREPRRGQSEENLPVTTSNLQTRLRQMLKCPTAILLTLAFVGMIMVNAAYLAWTPTLLYRKFGLDLAHAGFHATFWHHAGAVIGVIAGGRLGDRWGSKAPISRPLILAMGLLLGAPFIFLLGWSNSFPMVVVALTLFGVFRGFYDSNTYPTLYHVIRPDSRATATGMFLSAGFLGGGFAPVVVGWLAENTHLGLGGAIAGMSLCFLFSGSLILIACGGFFERDRARMEGTLDTGS